MSRISYSAFSGETLLLDSKEAAAYLGCCVASVQSYARRGRLPGQIVGGRWLFRQQDLEDFQSGRIGRPSKRQKPDTRTEEERRAALERLRGWP